MDRLIYEPFLLLLSFKSNSYSPFNNFSRVYYLHFNTCLEKNKPIAVVDVSSDSVKALNWVELIGYP